MAIGYQSDDVGEFQPNREQFSLEMKLEELKSEWEQITIPLKPSNNRGQADLPIGGRIEIERTNFHIQISGDVSVNGTVRMWHQFKVGDEYSNHHTGWHRVDHEIFGTESRVLCNAGSQSSHTAQVWRVIPLSHQLMPKVGHLSDFDAPRS